jgi:hypothetical protein
MEKLMQIANPEDDLFSDAMDAAISYYHGVRHGIMRNAERSGEIADGETVARRALAAGIKAYLAELPNPICIWVQEQDYPVYYAGCKENEEFHLAPGMDLYPHCHWCGGLIEICPQADTAGAPRRG